MIESPSNREKSPFTSSSSPISPNVTAGSHSIMNHLMRRKSPFTRSIPEEKEEIESKDEKKIEKEDSTKPLAIKVSEIKPVPDRVRNPTPTQSLVYHLAAKSPSAVANSLESPSKLKSISSTDPEDKPRSPQLSSPTDPSDEAKSKKIYEAASRGDFLSLCKSIEDDVNCVGVNYKGGYGLTALIISAEKGQVVALRMLIRAGSDVNAASNFGTTALHRSACNGHAICVNELLTAKATVDTQDRDGWTPLHYAFAKNHEDCILALVKANSSLDIKNVDGKTAFECTSDPDFKAQVMSKIDSYVQDQKKNLDFRLKKPDVIIFDYLKAGNVQGVKDLLCEDPKLINAKVVSTDNDKKDVDGDTPLIVASLHGNAACVRILLEYKADVNEQSKAGKTALIYASVNGNADCVKALLEYGVNVNMRSFYGNTALNYSSYYGRLEVVKLLLDAKADVDVANNDGKTALMNASSRGYKDIVDLLLAANANIKLTNNKGNTAVDVAKTQSIKDTILNSSQSRALELEKVKAKEEEESRIKIQEEILLKYRESLSEAAKLAEFEREVLLKLIRERDSKKRLTLTEIEKKRKERSDLEEKRSRIEEELKKQEIMRAKREEEREKEEEKKRESKRSEQRLLDLSKFKSEKEALLSLINERNKKKMLYMEKLAAVDKELSKTKPTPLPAVPRAILNKVYISDDNIDSNETEVTIFLKKIGLEIYRDFFHSHGAEKLSDFSYYANGHFDQLKLMFPEFASTLKHFHQIRFYEELRKYFNIITPQTPPEKTPSRHSPWSNVQSPPADKAY